MISGNAKGVKGKKRGKDDRGGKPLRRPMVGILFVSRKGAKPFFSSFPFRDKIRIPAVPTSDGFRRASLPGSPHSFPPDPPPPEKTLNGPKKEFPCRRNPRECRVMLSF